MFSMQLADHSGEQWMSVFGDKGDTIFGLSANEMKEFYDTKEAEAFEARVDQAMFRKHSEALEDGCRHASRHASKLQGELGGNRSGQLR